jgi:hypothetical protein
MLMVKEKEGEGGGIDGNLHLFLPVNRDEIKLSPVRESQRARLASGQWLRGSMGANRERTVGRGGVQAFILAVALEKLVERGVVLWAGIGRGKRWCCRDGSWSAWRDVLEAS